MRARNLVALGFDELVQLFDGGRLLRVAADVQDLRDAVEFAKHPTYEVPKTGFLYGMGSNADGREMMRIGMKGWLDASYETE